MASTSNASRHFASALDTHFNVAEAISGDATALGADASLGAGTQFPQADRARLYRISSDPPAPQRPAPDLVVERQAIPLTAADVRGSVAGYYVSESGITPSPGVSGWLTTAPPSVSLSAGDGAKTLYAWAKDELGNVSGPANDSTVLDTTRPTAGIVMPARSVSRLILGNH